MRTPALFLLVSAASIAALAAPVPAPTEKEQIAKLWGKTIAPSDECEFKLNGKALTVRTQGMPLRGLIMKDKATSVRTARTASGDFVMTVKVAAAAAPNRDPNHQDSWPKTRAGLYISGGGYGVELHHAQYYTKTVDGQMNEALSQYVWVDTWFPGGGAGNTIVKTDPARSTYLRVTRKDKGVSVQHSVDGKEWSAPFAPRRELAFPAEVTVGIFVDHSTHQVVDAAFDEFTVEKIEKK
jgi:hypothetical protein